MRYLIFISFLFSTSAYAQTISRIEYYFDTDPGFGNGISIPVTAAADLTRDFSVPLNTVGEGIHILYVRAKSNTGFWSMPLGRAVFVQRNAQTASLYSINRLEYFLDTDPGFGSGISIPLTSAVDVTKDFQLPLSVNSEGFHTVYFRARSSNGLWSVPTSKPVFIQHNAQTATSSTLKKLEYFLDSDPGVGNATSIPLTTSAIDQSLSIDLSTATLGFHVLYMRSQDANGRWSLPFAKPFFVTRSGSNIVALEYYYTDGTTQSPKRIYNSFTPGKDLTINFEAVLEGLLPTTSYQIHVTAINADGQRSDKTIHTFVTPAIICDPLSAPTTNGASRCGSGVVTLNAAGATGTQTYRWYTTATGGSALAGETSSALLTPSLVSTTTYYVAILNGTCESNRTAVIATILDCNQPPVITPASTTVTSDGTATFDLTSLITDPDNNLDAASIAVVTPPPSNALTSISNTILSVDYSGINFAGIETLTLQACDLLNSCTLQLFTLEVTAELTIYNGLSPNGDFKNEVFRLKFIEWLPDAQKNKVSIYNRWGSLVFDIADYNNTTNVFRGLNNSGNELPTGVYFYKIEFESGRKPINGYLTLKK